MTRFIVETHETVSAAYISIKEKPDNYSVTSWRFDPDNSAALYEVEAESIEYVIDRMTDNLPNPFYFGGVFSDHTNDAEYQHYLQLKEKFENESQ